MAGTGDQSRQLALHPAALDRFAELDNPRKLRRDDWRSVAVTGCKPADAGRLLSHYCAVAVNRGSVQASKSENQNENKDKWAACLPPLCSLWLRNLCVARLLLLPPSYEKANGQT